MNTHTNEFNEKAQFHLHRLAEGVMKFCHGIKKNTLGCQPVIFNFSVDILSKAKLLNAATTTWFYPRLNLIPYYMNESTFSVVVVLFAPCFAVVSVTVW